MNAVTRQLVITFGPMVLKAVIDSILNEEQLSKYRDQMIAYMREACKKTVNEVDDAAMEVFIGAIMDPTRFVPQTLAICNILKKYIVTSEKKWDDTFFLPIINRIELLGTGR